jgi:hypothetical protein
MVISNQYAYGHENTRTRDYITGDLLLPATKVLGGCRLKRLDWKDGQRYTSSKIKRDQQKKITS